MGNILVIAETSGGRLRKATLSAITFARELSAKAGGDIHVAVIGNGVGPAAQEAAGFGAKTVLVVDHPFFSSYVAAPWARVVADLATQADATHVAGASTTFTRDMLPRVAARLGAGMVSEVLSVLGPNRFKRPMWAGNVVATVEVRTPKAVFTIRGTDFAPAAPGGGPSPIQAIAVTPQDDGRARFLGVAPTVSKRPELTEAQCVVAGGRGLKDRAGFFGTLDPLADLFNAAIGGTRAAVDGGLLENDLQIGQTGKVVAPNLYFGVGLSGAIQHLAGMKNSKTIVAINKDAEAPIFSVADYGLVGDAFKVVPELVEEIRKVRK